MNSRGTVAIVTGAGTGIGKETALALLGEGYAVTLAGRRRERLEAVAEESGLPGSRVLVVPTDISEPESVHALFARTMGQIHVDHPPLQEAAGAVRESWESAQTKGELGVNNGG